MDRRARHRTSRRVLQPTSLIALLGLAAFVAAVALPSSVWKAADVLDVVPPPPAPLGEGLGSAARNGGTFGADPSGVPVPSSDGVPALSSDITTGVTAVSSGQKSTGVIPSEPAPYVGSYAPPFALTSLQGETVQLNGLRGRTVVVNFWATWCEPCKQEMPEIEKAHRTLDDVVFLGVNIDEPKETVAAFIEQYGYSFTILLDPGARVMLDYLVRFVPTTFFIDPNGVIRKIYLGPMDLGTIRRLVNEVREAGAGLEGTS